MSKLTFKKIKNSGFTFIELLLVLVLIIAIAGLTIPSVLNYQRSQAENEEIKNIVSSLRTAQNLALTTDTSYSLTIQARELNICSVETSECKKIISDFLNINSRVSNIFFDRYGNLVDQNNSLISNNLILVFPSSFVIVNKFGRIYVQDRQ